MKKSNVYAAIAVVVLAFLLVIIYSGVSQANHTANANALSEAGAALDKAYEGGMADEIAAAEDAMDVAQKKANANFYGILTILPPLIAIVLAFLTKNVIVSLFIGMGIGAFMVQLANPGISIFAAFFEGFIDMVARIINQMADSWNAGVILQVLAIGGVIALVTRLGGAHALAEAIGRRAKSQRGSQFATWLMGILIFFDDYANALIVGSVMRPISDRTKVSREKLSFVVDATAAPVAGIALVSTWIAVEMSAISEGFSQIAETAANYAIAPQASYVWFTSSIPFRFYNILMLAFVVITILLLKDFGPMRKAQRRAFKDGTPLRPDSIPMVSVDTEQGVMPAEGAKKSIWDAIIPIGILIVGSFLAFWYNGYAASVAAGDATDFLTCFSNADASVVLFQVAIVAGIVALLMGVFKKRFTMEEGIKTWVSGWKGLIITVIILLFAWGLNSTIKALGTNIFLVSTIGASVPYWVLPAIIFLLGSIISFATGTSYGTMLILTPLTVPLANSVILATGNGVIADPTIYMLGCIGAVLTGAIFGDHCSPISDTTILSSMGASCDHLDHVKTQLPYALIVAAISIVFGYLLIGLGLNVFLTLAVGLVITFITVHFVGKNPKVPLKGEEA